MNPQALTQLSGWGGKSAGSSKAAMNAADRGPGGAPGNRKANASAT
ncbi:hypothetical protein HC231_04805 [Brenneria izadpanahii]|uniref:Uncharacterized protein n=1 Tax=Brenneria izadpanahii TaxID=2722756 RepID=A0ABX7UUN7_9GAMM|nr:hypothetical protein [Brenneria izadpanahii]QTF07324.1 hypothetical protein HC231_04805 [Brenneria izadpanahii]